MAVSHVFSNAQGDFTGTVTGFNSQASTVTLAATNLVRPVDWNSAHNQFYTLSGNTNNASTASGTNVVFQGVGGVTLIGSTGTIGISAAPPGTATMWWPFNEAVNVAGGQGNATLAVCPIPTPPTAALGVVHADRICFPMNFSYSTNSTGTVSLTVAIGFYTKNAATLSLAHSSSGSTTVGYSSTNSTSIHHGIRLFTLPWTTTIDDNRYYVGVLSRSSTGGNNCTLQQIVVSAMASSYSGVLGAASNASLQWPLGFGIYSTSTAAIPATIGFTQLVGNSSIAARAPTWFMISGTV
jgi:hypothetical protein